MSFNPNLGDVERASQKELLLATSIPPFVIPLIMMAAGAVAKGVGNRRTQNNTNRQVTAESQRQEKEAMERARGRSALIRGILNANGFGGSMTDDQIMAMATRTPGRPVLGSSSIFTGIGNGLSTIGSSALAGSAGGAAQQQQSNDSWWEDFYRQLQQNQSAYGAAPRSGPSGPFSYGGENAP